MVIHETVYDKLTALLPKKSAVLPLITAPIIAPMVNIEPNKEYCNIEANGRVKKLKASVSFSY